MLSEICRPRQDYINICYHIVMFLGISNCVTNMVNIFPSSKISFITTPDEIKGMET